MATRSIIGILDGNTVKSVYSHWDGYPEHNGKILISSYQTKEKVQELIGNGPISELGPTIGETRFFNQPDDIRDHTYDEIPDQKTVLQDIHEEEFVYLFDCRDNMWYMLKQWEYDGQSKVIFVSEAVMELS